MEDQLSSQMGVLGVRCGALPVIMGCVPQTVSPPGPNIGDSVAEHAAVPLWEPPIRQPGDLDLASLITGASRRETAAGGG